MGNMGNMGNTGNVQDTPLGDKKQILCEHTINGGLPGYLTMKRCLNYI